jgi:hypothetical protein
MTPRRRPHKRRTCWDQVRLQELRGRRRGDPALSGWLQLLAIILFVIRRAPFLSFAAVSGLRSQPPRRDDWSREQQEREEGRGGQRAALLTSATGSSSTKYRVMPSYKRLIRDLRRPNAATSANAAGVLRRRVPTEALPWLENVLNRGDWAALAWCTRPGMSKEETENAMLQSALGWTAALHDPDSCGPAWTTSRPDKP